MAVFSTGLLAIAKTFIEGNKTSLYNAFALLIIGGIEAIVSSEKLFVCPREGYASYGWAFIFGPAVIFFLISLLLRDDFRKLVQGCCYYEETQKKCRKPRWWCSRKLFRIIFECLVISSMWLFFAFFQREYYVCARLGNRSAEEKEALLNVPENSNKEKEIKKSIEEKFNSTGDDSQYIGLFLVFGILSVSFLILLAKYCCCQRPYFSLPPQYKYEKLEAQAAVEAFKEKMTEYAQKKGKKHAEEHFSENNRDVLIKTYKQLRQKYDTDVEFPNETDEAIARPFRDQEATAARQAFNVRVKTAGIESGKERVGATVMDQAFLNVQKAKEHILKHYPITSGDLGKAYVESRDQSEPQNENPDGNSEKVRPQSSQSLQ